MWTELLLRRVHGVLLVLEVLAHEALVHDGRQDGDGLVVCRGPRLSNVVLDGDRHLPRGERERRCRAESGGIIHIPEKTWGDILALRAELTGS